MPKKNPNGYGGITKLSGNRRKPYMAYTSEIVTEGTVIQREQKKALDKLTEAIKGASSGEEAFTLLESTLAVLYEATGDCFSTEKAVDYALKILKTETDSKLFKARQKKSPLGYYATYKEASLVLAEYNKNPEDFINGSITFAECWDMVKPTLQLEEKTKNTQHSYKTGYEKCESLYDMPMKDIKTVHLQKIVDEYRDKSAPLQRQIVTVLHALYRFAVQNDIVDKDYSQFVKVTSQRQTSRSAFTPEEVQIIRDNIGYLHRGTNKSPYDDIPVSKILLVLIYTGVRINELFSIKVADVNLKHKYLVVNGTKTANSVRIVPIHSEIEAIVTEMCEDGSEYLFHRKDGAKLIYSSFKNTCYKRYCSIIGISHTIHETRHTFATYSALQLNPKARAFIIGHAQGITDDRYTHPELIADQLKTEIDKLKI